MPTYTDYKNRTWDVVIDVTTLKRVHRLTGHLLTDLLLPNSDTFKQVNVEAFLFPDMLYAALKPQCDAASVTDEQFGEGLLGDAYNAAWEATLAAAVNFTQNPAQRAIQAELLTKSKQAAALVIKQATAELATIQPEQMAAKMIEASSSSVPATSSPASPE